MAKIEELLAELKELDHETWDRLDYNVQIQERNWSNIGNPRLLWLMQGVIQEAATARGWRATAGTPDDYLDGTIDAVARISWWDGDVRRGVVEFAPTSAEALLRAYIAALDAHREAEK